MTPDISPADLAAEIDLLRASKCKLAEDKANLQLIISLVAGLNPLSGLEDMVRGMLYSIVTAIGGTNIKMYYWIDTELHYIDFLGENRTLAAIDDAQVAEVAERREFIESTAAAADSQMHGALVPGSWTWTFPLLLGQDLIGIIKLENINISGKSLRNSLPMFFSHVTLILSNEIRNYKRERAEAALHCKSMELARSNAELQRFAEITAHHLQEPARRIATYADRLTRQLAGKLDDEQTRLSLEFINQQARRQKNLLRDVERYLAATQPRGEVISIAPRATLEQMLLGMAAQIRAAGATIELRELPPARIDLPRLKDLFAVALDNALKHGRNEQGLHITIAGERVGERVRYCVSDNGPGVATEYGEQVFLVFERLTSSGEDTGIGLAILRRVVESTDGRAWIETTPGGGCSVMFELPLGETP